MICRWIGVDGGSGGCMLEVPGEAGTKGGW